MVIGNMFFASKTADPGTRSQFIIILMRLNLTYGTILSRSLYSLLRNLGDIE